MPFESLDQVLELLDYCEQFADLIYVREQVDGHWGSFALSQLPVALVLRNVRRWVDRGHRPIRLRTPEETET